MDPSLISASLVEDVIEEPIVLVADTETQDEQLNFPAADVEDIVDETSTHDFQQAVESGVEARQTHPASPIRFLVGGDPNTAEEVPTEGIISFFFLLFFFFITTFIYISINMNTK